MKSLHACLVRIFLRRIVGGCALESYTVALSSTYFKIKHNCSLKALKYMYTILGKQHNKCVTTCRIHLIRRHGYYLFHCLSLNGIYLRAAFVNISNFQRSNP